MRGFAVVLMVIGHSLDSVLTNEARTTGWFQVYDFFRGFTAPLFLFVSGLAFSVATGKRWTEHTRYSPHLRRRLLRILLLFAIGYALHVPFLSLEKTFSMADRGATASLFQADVLQCVAGSLLLLHVLILLLRSKTLFIHVLTLLVPAIVLLTPLVSREDFSSVLSPVLSPYLNRQQLSLFPLFPYAAFLFAGTVAGYYLLQWRQKAGEQQVLVRIAGFGAAAALLAVVTDLLPLSVYPLHDFWKTNPIFFLLRLGVVAEIAVVFILLRGIPETLRHRLTLLGRWSLLVYTVHIVIVYGSALNSGLAQIVGRTLPATSAFIAAAGILLGMTLLVHAWDHARSHHYHLSRYLQAGLGSSLLYLFLIRPF
jgi:hypothetical protein